MEIETNALDELAGRLRESDHGAYQDIFQCMHTPLLRYVCRMTRDEGVALDVLQDVFLKLWEKREEVVVHSSFKAMLYTMARNQTLNVLRNRKRMTYDSSLIDDNHMGGEESHIEHSLQAMQLDGFFKAWVKELPPRRGEAFILSRYHALNHHEIGEIMGLSKRTVDTHIVHALKYLKKKYEELR